MNESRPVPMINFGPGATPEHYLVNKKNEITQIIFNLCKKTLPVTIYLDGNPSRYFITRIHSVKPEHGLLGIVLPPGKMIGDLGDFDKAVCVANHNLAHIQFDVSKAGNSEAMIMAMLPDALTRLRRRTEERLSLQEDQPLHCSYISDDGNRIHMKVTDISMGGVGLICADQGIQLERGSRIINCVIELSDSEQITADLEVRNTAAITTREHTEATLLNCSFVESRVDVLARIQDFVHSLGLRFRKSSKPRND